MEMLRLPKALLSLLYSMSYLRCDGAARRWTTPSQHINGGIASSATPALTCWLGARRV